MNKRVITIIMLVIALIIGLSIIASKIASIGSSGLLGGIIFLYLLHSLDD